MNMALRENYHALLVSICTGMPAEKAFVAIGCYGAMSRNSKQAKPEKPGNRKRKAKPKNLTDEQLREMAAMREDGMVYKDIGECFGLSASAAYARIKRYKERVRDAESG